VFGWLTSKSKALTRRSRNGNGAADRVRVSDLVGSARLVRVRLVRGSYDAAKTTPDNLRHWAHADALSADAAASADVRRTLRNRARYEVANNSYARGIILTLANDAVGTGPRLQLLTDSDAIHHPHAGERRGGHRAAPPASDR